MRNLVICAVLLGAQCVVTRATWFGGTQVTGKRPADEAAALPPCWLCTYEQRRQYEERFGSRPGKRDAELAGASQIRPPIRIGQPGKREAEAETGPSKRNAELVGASPKSHARIAGTQVIGKRASNEEAAIPPCWLCTYEQRRRYEEHFGSRPGKRAAEQQRHRQGRPCSGPFCDEFGLKRAAVGDLSDRAEPYYPDFGLKREAELGSPDKRESEQEKVACGMAHASCEKNTGKIVIGPKPTNGKRAADVQRPCYGPFCDLDDERGGPDPVFDRPSKRDAELAGASPKSTIRFGRSGKREAETETETGLNRGAWPDIRWDCFLPGSSCYPRSLQAAAGAAEIDSPDKRESAQDPEPCNTLIDLDCPVGTSNHKRAAAAAAADADANGVGFSCCPTSKNCPMGKPRCKPTRGRRALPTP